MATDATTEARTAPRRRPLWQAFWGLDGLRAMAAAPFHRLDNERWQIVPRKRFGF
jgi:hypothetical protein